MTYKLNIIYVKVKENIKNFFYVSTQGLECKVFKLY